MGLFKRSSSQPSSDKIPWNSLTTPEELEAALKASGEHDNGIVIFKHSTRCGTSSMALSRFERQWDLDPLPAYFVDVVRNRDISNAVAEKLEVPHASPQLLLIQNGACVYNISHNGISVEALKEHL